MVAFIDAERETYGVEPMGAVLPIAPATYFRHKAWQAHPVVSVNSADQICGPKRAVR